MNNSYIKLIIAALLPVAATAIIALFEKKTAFGKVNVRIRQVIYGIVFGGLAVIGTEWGIPLEGAMLNCRDSSVLTAGLFFGGPAGIIAGLIGGIERWLACFWGAGEFTRIACTVSTIIAGFYSALLRKYLFDNKRPGWIISLSTGVVMEVLHLTMVFLTNMSDVTKAMNVVRVCTAPMVIANGVSVMLSAVVLTVIAREKLFVRLDKVRISQTVQRWLLVTVLLAFAGTSVFVFSLQNKIADAQAESLLTLAIDEVSADIADASDANLMSICRSVESHLTDGRTVFTDRTIEKGELLKEQKQFGLSEVSVINPEGTIICSTDNSYVNFEMLDPKNKQSFDFMENVMKEGEYVQEYGAISSDSNVLRKYAGKCFGEGEHRYCVQVGYDAELFHKDLADEMVGITKNRHVGESGYILIVDEQMQVVSAPDSLDLDKLTMEENFTPSEDEIFTIMIGDEPCRCRFRETEGYYIVSLLPETEALRMRNIALYVNTFMEILVFAILFGLIYMLVKRVVVDQLKRVNRSLGRIAGGDLEEVVDVRTNAEFSSLSDDINSTVDTLKRYIDEASARIDKELEFAKSIQASALPNVFPAFPKKKEIDIYAIMDPAKEVGGDFYDFYITHEELLHFLIADVSGKGIPAAMFMMRAKTELKSLTEADVALCDVFTNGNRALCEGNDAGMFVTAWQGQVDLTSGKVQYANAGHNPPLVRHGDGRFEYLRSRAGFVLAGMEGVRYKAQELELEPGDIVFLYTDGVTEATNADGELFGEERLLETINSRAYDDMKSLCTFVKSEVDRFVGDADQFDDITMVALRYFGKPVDPSICHENASLADIPAVTEFVEAELEKLDCPPKTVIQINVAIDELYSNIVKYGYPDDQKGPVTVEVGVREDPHRVYVKFVDEGIPYNPLTKEDPDVTLSAEDRKIGGLGIYLVKKTMDDIRYKYENGLNILTISKNL